MALRRLTPSQMPLLMDALEEKARPGMKFATVLEGVYREHLTGVPGEVTAMFAAEHKIAVEDAFEHARRMAIADYPQDPAMTASILEWMAESYSAVVFATRTRHAYFASEETTALVLAGAQETVVEHSVTAVDLPSPDGVAYLNRADGALALVWTTHEDITTVAIATAAGVGEYLLDETEPVSPPLPSASFRLSADGTDAAPVPVADEIEALPEQQWGSGEYDHYAAPRAIPVFLSLVHMLRQQRLIDAEEVTARSSHRSTQNGPRRSGTATITYLRYSSRSGSALGVVVIVGTHTGGWSAATGGVSGTRVCRGTFRFGSLITSPDRRTHRSWCVRRCGWSADRTARGVHRHSLDSTCGPGCCPRRAGMRTRDAATTNPVRRSCPARARMSIIGGPNTAPASATSAAGGRHRAMASAHRQPLLEVHVNADNRIPTSSPWGAVQDGRVLADGIIIVWTSGHGGVRISPERLKQMPAALRLGRRRWFEEDCEAALVGLAFADDLEFTDSRRDDLAAVVANWFPTNWEAYFGRTLEPGESYLRDKETFEAATADQFVVDSALGDWHEDVPAGLVGVTALRRSDGIRGKFLVAAERYSRRDRFGYVIDETVDVVWSSAPKLAA